MLDKHGIHTTCLYINSDSQYCHMPRKDGGGNGRTHAKPVSKTSTIEQMASIDRQCSLCGWPFKWSGGDFTAVGQTLYQIEQLYTGMNNNAYKQLFSEHQQAHLLHQHSRNTLQPLLPKISAATVYWFTHRFRHFPLGVKTTDSKDKLRYEPTLNLNYRFSTDRKILEKLAHDVKDNAKNKAKNKDNVTKPGGNTDDDNDEDKEEDEDEDPDDIERGYGRSDTQGAFETSFMDQNIQRLVKNVTKQATWTLQTAMSTFSSMGGEFHSDDEEDLGDSFCLDLNVHEKDDGYDGDPGDGDEDEDNSGGGRQKRTHSEGKHRPTFSPKPTGSRAGRKPAEGKNKPAEG